MMLTTPDEPGHDHGACVRRLISILALGLLAGSVVGGAAQEEEAAAAAPVEFEARWGFGHELRFETSTSSGVDVVGYRDGAWRPRVLFAATDPRFAGALTLATNLVGV